MDQDQFIKVYSSQTADYEQAFQVFLDHTDQKKQARIWLDACAAHLPGHKNFIDVGAGTGQVTAWLSDQFKQTLAIEPNPFLCQALRQACPQAQVMQTMILDAQPPSQGDLILCSHVFYYLPAETWLSHLEKMASWLAPNGQLVVLLQNSETDCMKMLRHFCQQRFDLAGLARQFESAHPKRYAVTIETVPAYITTSELGVALIIAEFILNLLEMKNPPERALVKEYIQKHFLQADGSYRFSCHQDFLSIRHQEYTDMLEKNRVPQDQVKILTLPTSQTIRSQIVTMITEIQKNEYALPVTEETNVSVLKAEDNFYFHQSCNFWYATDTHGKVIGSVGLRKLDKHNAEIKKFFVHRDYRGKGVAQKLMRSAIKAAIKHNFCDVYLGTADVLRAAQRFYEKFGFSQIEKEQLPAPFEIFPLDSVFFKLNLSKSHHQDVALPSE